jgi:hypothetical protein
MPTIPIYRHECALLNIRDACARWEEWSFAPLPEVARKSEYGFRHYRGPAREVRVRVPPGWARDVDAEAVHWLAARGERGFRLEEDDMGRRRRDDEPGLFDGVAETGPPDCVHDESARVDRLEDAIRRALEQHRLALAEGQDGRYATARAILEGVLER